MGHLSLAGTRETGGVCLALAITSPSAIMDLLKLGLPQRADGSIGGLKTFSNWEEKMHDDW